MRINPVHRVLNRPLTVCGAQREHFFLALTVGAAGWIGLGTLLGGIGLFLISFVVARRITITDPKIPYILIRAGKWKAECDPRAWRPVRVAILRTPDA